MRGVYVPNLVLTAECDKWWVVHRLKGIQIVRVSFRASVAVECLCD